MKLFFEDKKNKFKEVFNTKNGFYMRTGILDEHGIDTDVDPFMRCYPQLLDVGIMGHCQHGKLGLCKKAGIDCYQNGLNVHNPHMTLKNFKKIVDESAGKVFQIALGGRGDPNKHPHFREIVEYCREHNIAPNYTTSGLKLTDEEVQITREWCGAVAVSEYRGEHTKRALEMFITAGCKTNIHYVLSNKTIDEAIIRLRNNIFPKGLNAVIFLMHKPVGLGTQEDVLDANDPKVEIFFELVDTGKFDFKIGFDACSIPGIINHTKNIQEESIDSCEGSRFSAYVTSDMKMLPCSFDNDEMKWAYDISNDSIKNAWYSEQFEDFRNYLRNSCPSCNNRHMCLGGCPIKNEIVLCDRKEKTHEN